MSRAKLDLVCSGYHAFNRGDIDAVLALLDPEIEWSQSPETAPEGTVYRGHQGVRELLSAVLDSITALEGLDEHRVEPRRVLDAGGDQVLVEVRWSVRSAVMGTELARTETHLWTVRDGKGLAVREYSDWGQALEAVGLRE